MSDTTTTQSNPKSRITATGLFFGLDSGYAFSGPKIVVGGSPPASRPEGRSERFNRLRDGKNILLAEHCVYSGSI